MKSRVRHKAAILAAVLLTPVLALWAGSYWRVGYVQHRDASWESGMLSSRSASVGVSQGRFELVVSHHSLNMDVSRGAGSKLGGYLPLQAFNSRTGGKVFHGWEFGMRAAASRPRGEMVYESVLGLAWDKVATPGEGDGIVLRIPAWYVVAFVLIPPAWMIRSRRRGRSSCRYDAFAGLRGRPALA